MLEKLKVLKNEVRYSRLDAERKTLVLYAIDCAIDEEERMEQMAIEYEERFKWV